MISNVFINANTILISFYDFIREFLDSYLSINLHISGGQTGGRSCVTQVTLCVDGTYCLSVPTLAPQSWGVQCGHVPR